VDNSVFDNETMCSLSNTESEQLAQIQTSVKVMPLTKK